MALPGMDPALGCQTEWHGQFSGAFIERHSAKPQGKRMVDTNIRNGDSASLARNGFGQYFCDTRGLVIPESKKILPSVGSQVFDWRPSKRPLSQPGADHIVKAEGRRLAEEAPGKALAIREKRHIRQVESKEEHSDRPVGPRTVIREHNGLRAAEQPAREVDLTYEMQRKAKDYSLRDMRSGIGCKSYGDKAYKHPEYSDRFFQMGNLITGAGFARGHFKRTEPRNATSVVLVEVQRKEGALTFAEKEEQMLATEARTEVEELTQNWERNVLKTTGAANYEEPSDSEDEGPGAPATK